MGAEQQVQLFVREIVLNEGDVLREHRPYLKRRMNVGWDIPELGIDALRIVRWSTIGMNTVDEDCQGFGYICGIVLIFCSSE
ncbi:hypothetical protein OSTOST_25744 [Ostertagia ostertagi]